VGPRSPEISMSVGSSKQTCPHTALEAEFEEADIQRILDANTGRQPVYIQIGLCGDKHVFDSVLDSGSSMSLVSLEVYSFLSYNYPRLMKSVQPNGRRMFARTASGDLVTVLEQFVTEVYFSSERRKSLVLFGVVATLPCHVLLGVPVFDEWKPSFDLKNNYVTLDGCKVSAVSHKGSLC